MLKISFFFLVFWFFALQTKAQTLHAILVANTKSVMPEFAEVCKADLANMKLETREMAHGAGYKWQLYELSGDDFTPAKLQTLTSSVQVPAGDVLLFYFSGAAFCDSTDAARNCERFLRLGKEGKDLIYSDYLFKTLEDKGARLNVFITDGCSLIRQAPKKERNRGLAAAQRVYRSLLSATGTVRIFSSQCTEYSYGDARGSLFTNALLLAIDQAIKTDTPHATWRYLVNEASKTTVSQALAILCRPQHPWGCWEGLKADQ